jgi:hypothetical protein
VDDRALRNQQELDDSKPLQDENENPKMPGMKKMVLKQTILM